ncbi:MAG: ribosomal-processing cysteine protease Prp [Bacilli bacterium]|nr:ribosomal-processing cysteine protease Prp [Bacilli bacterium]
MIKVVCSKDNKNITISGHALYDDYGKDIVCASVTSIVTTTINAILSFDNDAIYYEAISGKIVIEVKKDTRETRILIRNMMNLLTELSETYKKNIKIC